MMKEKKMNENQELLDWAVTNIKEWNEEYTDLRSDNTVTSLFWTTNRHWFVHDTGDWRDYGGGGTSYLPVDSPFYTTTPQVITKVGWKEARALQKENKSMKQEFTKSMLVAGVHVVETREGYIYTLLGNFLKGFGDSGGYLFVYNYSECLLELDRDDELLDIVKVYEVSQKEGHLGFNESLHLVWERCSEEKAKLLKEKEELEARLKQINDEIEGGGNQ